MTTLAANKPRIYEIGRKNDLPVINADVIYEGAAVGIVDATGYARPLTTADGFAGFAEAKADNAAGAAAAINVPVIEQGEIQLSVSGAVITDVGQPVYATDDDTFVFSPAGVFIGFVKRFVSSGVVVVRFDVGVLVDPHAGWTPELKSANFTADIQDSGKVIVIDTDAVVVTLPATAAGGKIRFLNIGAFGTVGFSLSPASTDKVQGPDIAGTDNKDLINTKATARRGDYVDLIFGETDGPYVAAMRGTWATEA